MTLKQCRVCKEERPTSCFYRSGKSSDGLDSLCKKCHRAGVRISLAKRPDYYRKADRDLTRTLRGRWRKMRKTAFCRNMDVLLTFEQYENLIKPNRCHYCENSLPMAGGGIDRLDSSKGYIDGNCVPCCHICNQMKNDLTVQDFLSHISKIVRLHRPPYKPFFTERFWQGWYRDQESNLQFVN